MVAVGCFGVGGKRNSSPMLLTKATISIPWLSRKTFSAIAPAATRAIVSRAEERPPPEEAFTPYFSSLWLKFSDGFGG